MPRDERSHRSVPSPREPRARVAYGKGRSRRPLNARSNYSSRERHLSPRRISNFQTFFSFSSLSWFTRKHTWTCYFSVKDSLLLWIYTHCSRQFDCKFEWCERFLRYFSQNWVDGLVWISFFLAFSLFVFVRAIGGRICHPLENLSLCSQFSSCRIIPVTGWMCYYPLEEIICSTICSFSGLSTNGALSKDSVDPSTQRAGQSMRENGHPIPLFYAQRVTPTWRLLQPHRWCTLLPFVQGQRSRSVRRHFNSVAWGQNSDLQYWNAFW